MDAWPMEDHRRKRQKADPSPQQHAGRVKYSPCLTTATCCTTRSENGRRLDTQGGDRGVNMGMLPGQASSGETRLCFDGGVNNEDDSKVKHRVGAGWLMLVAEQWQALGEPQWQTVLEVRKNIATVDGRTNWRCASTSGKERGYQCAQDLVLVKCRGRQKCLSEEYF